MAGWPPHGLFLQRSVGEARKTQLDLVVRKPGVVVALARHAAEVGHRRRPEQLSAVNIGESFRQLAERLHKAKKNGEGRPSYTTSLEMPYGPAGIGAMAAVQTRQSSEC